MSTKKKNISLVLVLALGSLCGFLFLSLRAQTSPDDAKISIEKDLNDWRKESRSTFPIVEYTDQKLSGTYQKSDAYRKAKSQKYGRIPVLDSSASYDNEEMVYSHWASGLSALPVEQSDAILVGTVTEALAFLSDNRVSVFSEFNISIEKIIKSNAIDGLKADGCVAAEREGGIVRYPSGIETWFHVSDQSMPTEKHRYLFFLTHTFPELGVQEKDFHILTAYEINNGTIIPLDRPGGGTHPIARKYKGKSTSVVLDDLSSILKGEPTDRLKNED